MRAQKTGSGMTMRASVAVPRNVSSTTPATNPRLAPPINPPMAKAASTQAVTPSAFGKRAANSVTPKIRNELAIIQYSNGGFTRRGTPLFWGTNQSPPSAITRAAPAYCPSVSL